MNVAAQLNANIARRNANLKSVLDTLRKKAPSIYHRYAPVLVKNAGLGETSSWSDLAKNIVDLAVTVKASNAMDDKEKQQLQLQLQQIQEQNKALDKQLEIAKTVQATQAMTPVKESAGSAFMRTFQDYPVQWLAVAGLLTTLLVVRRKGGRRR
jgi:hypothetical protein